MGTKKALIVAVLAIFPANASAQYYDYSWWSQNDQMTRAIYMAGLADGLIGVAELPATRGWRHCIAQLRMKSDELAENVRTFAQPRADLHSYPMTLILREYLVAACRMDKAKKR